MRLAFVPLLVACQGPAHQRTVPMIVEMGPFGYERAPRFAARHDEPTALGQPPVHERAGTLAVATRIGGIVAKYLVLGGEVELGAGRSTSDAPSTIEQSLHLGIGAAIGLRGRFGRLSPSFEFFGGVRSIERHADDGWFYFQRNGVIERRVRLDVWLFDFMTIGVYGGRDLDGNWSIGWRTGYHVEPYDAD